jgi:hypothetical protein
MKLHSITKRATCALVALVVTIGAGCATQGPTPSPCPPKYPQHYADTTHRFSLCLPSGVNKTASGSTVTFNGFTVPSGTNLQAKGLIVVPGNYDMLQGATAAGSLTVDGVVLKRAQADEGSAGHSTLHVIYTWKEGSKVVHFDFTHRAVNVGNFDPPNRPQEYNRAAQLKLTEEIMSTFKRLP